LPRFQGFLPGSAGLGGSQKAGLRSSVRSKVGDPRNCPTTVSYNSRLSEQGENPLIRHVGLTAPTSVNVTVESRDGSTLPQDACTPAEAALL
jgi:hypothetical protein